jgi:hypothetical protein
MELVSERMNVLAQARDIGAHGPGGLFLGGSGKRPLHPGGVDRETGEPLAEIVVELSGEPSPLVLVRGKKAPRERPGLFLGDPAPGTLPK